MKPIPGRRDFPWLRDLLDVNSSYTVFRFWLRPLCLPPVNPFPDTQYDSWNLTERSSPIHLVSSDLFSVFPSKVKLSVQSSVDRFPNWVESPLPDLGHRRRDLRQVIFDTVKSNYGVSEDEPLGKSGKINWKLRFVKGRRSSEEVGLELGECGKDSFISGHLSL